MFQLETKRTVFKQKSRLPFCLSQFSTCESDIEKHVKILNAFQFFSVSFIPASVLSSPELWLCYLV